MKFVEPEDHKTASIDLEEVVRKTLHLDDFASSVCCPLGISKRPSLTKTQIRDLSRHFNTVGASGTRGYVLDFSDKTFDTFTTDTIGRTIRKPGLSKWKSLDTFLADEATPDEASTLLAALLDHEETTKGATEETARLRDILDAAKTSKADAIEANLSARLARLDAKADRIEAKADEMGRKQLTRAHYDQVNGIHTTRDAGGGRHKERDLDDAQVKAVLADLKSSKRDSFRAYCDHIIRTMKPGQYQNPYTTATALDSAVRRYCEKNGIALEYHTTRTGRWSAKS